MTIISTALLAGCGGGSKNNNTPDMAMADMSGPVIEGEHGTLVDYFSMMPLPGLTVTDGTNSTTTGADGTFLLPAPAMGATVSPFASGTGYATLHLPEGTVDSVDVNLGIVPMAQTSSFMLEQNILANDQTKAMVHILIVKTGACANLANGTVTVNAPAGAKVAYFSTAGIPTAPTMGDIVAPKPAAVVYDVTPNAAIDLTINAPGCTQVPFGTMPLNGFTLNGSVVAPATEPGDQVAALVFVLQ